MYLFQCRELLECCQGLRPLRELDIDGVLFGRELVLEVEVLWFYQRVLELVLRGLRAIEIQKNEGTSSA